MEPWEGIRGGLGRSEGEPWALGDEKVSPGGWRRRLCSGTQSRVANFIWGGTEKWKVGLLEAARCPGNWETWS